MRIFTIGVVLQLACAYASAQQVIAISDGDTLTVLESQRQVKIRLANIDAPEKKQAFGQRSKESLSELCFRKDATYEMQTIDKYGRTVAVVTCDGIEVNRAQVKRGMAWVYPKYNKDPSLPTVEAAARASGAGLWRESEPMPPWEFRRSK